MDDGTDQADGSSTQDRSSDQCLTSFSELESHQEDRPYKCNQCDKSYRHAGSLVNHKKTHQIGLYVCLICQKEYSNPMGLKSHLRTHSEERRFKCDQCGEAFRMSQQLYNHRKSLHGYYSTPNGEKIPKSPKFEVQSPILVESSNLMSNLENYIAESMLPVDFPQLVSKYYTDETAGEEGPAKDDAEEEEGLSEETEQLNDSNIDEYRYKCAQCGKAYKHAGSLANHKQSHMVGIYQCAVCYKEFSNLMAMKNHCRLHSDSRARQSCKSPRSSGKSVGASVDTPDPPQLTVLQSAEQSDNTPILPESSGNIKSEEETEEVPHTTYQNDLASSLSPLHDVPAPPFSSDSMIEGTDEAESKEMAKDFLVDQPESDDVHDEDAKYGDRPYKCQECGKTYRHAGSLINHKKTHQTGVYSCSLCSKQMFNMAALKNHVRAHFKSRAGRRLGDSFFPSASLSDEFYQNQEDPYQCGICDNVSTNETDFLQHQLHHQKLEINEITNDTLIEEAPQSGIWQETPQVSQGSSDDSAYSSGRGFPDIKIEMDNLVSQPWSRDDSVAMPPEIKLENQEADIQSADASSEQLPSEPVASKEAKSSGLEESQHMADHRPHKCEICDRTYRHKSSLINHKLTHKTGIYQCSLCPKQYSNLMALRNHVRFHSRSYAGRRGITSRRGRHFFRAKSRVLQNRNSQSLANSVKFSEEVRDAATTNRPEEDPLIGSQNRSIDCSEHLKTHTKICPSAITGSTDVRCDASASSDGEKDLSTVREPEEPQKNLTQPSENRRRRMYECDLCSKSYRHSGSLINHKRTHQTGDYMCPYCSKHVHNMAALKNHIRIHHKVKKIQQGELQADHTMLYPELFYGKGLYACVSCKETFHTENDLMSHQMLHLPHEGNQWDHQGLKSSPQNVQNNTSFNGAGNCDWDHSNNLDFQAEDRDLDLADDGQPEYTCVECGEVYDHIDDLNDHKRCHQAGIFQCSFCPKEYPNLLALRNHFETHTKPHALSLDGPDGHQFMDNQLPADNHYDCGHCGLIFSNEVDFHQHQVAHEKRKVMDESLPGLQDGEPEFSFSMHSSERELLSRIKSEIEETEPHGVNDGGSLLSHICGFCGKTYDDLESLEAHGLSHSNEGESCVNPTMVKDENREQHNLVTKEDQCSVKVEERPESRPYTCDQCGKTYRHGGSLVNHKKTHLVGNFQCVACSRHYPNLAAYRTHLRHHPKCKQPTALNNRSDLQTYSSIYPSGREKRLPYSPSRIPFPAHSAIRTSNIKKNTHYTTKDGTVQNTTTNQCYSLPPLNKKTSRRRVLRRFVRISEVQTSKQNSLEGSFKSEGPTLSDLEDKKLQVCKFCGKIYGVTELELHRTGNCGTSSAKDEKIQDLPNLPNFSLTQHEGETGYNRRPYRCEVCGRSYRHAGSLINHKQTHKTGVFRCSICQKRFFNLMAMKNHNRIHFELKRHTCLDCGKAFRLQKQLNTHQRIHRQRTSAKKLGRRNRKSRYRRFAQHKSLSEGSSVSEVCDARGKGSDSRVGREKDPSARPYQCEECGRSYRHAGSLFNHKKSHKTGQYHCSVCNKTYSNLMALKNHQRTHYEAKRHHCPQCGKNFKWKRQLLRHQHLHLQEGSQSDSLIPAGTEEAKTLDDHPEGHETSSFNKEDPHMNADEITQTSHDSDSPVCVSCGMSFADHADLKSHSCRENTIDPSACGDDEATKSTQLKNQDDRPHRCNICNRTYRHASSLYTHKSTHKRGNYQCSVCHKTFPNPISMRAHLRTHTARKHLQKVDCESSQDPTSPTGEKPFHCPTCNQGFSCQLTLRHHRRTHELSSSPFQSSSLTPNNDNKSSQSGGKLQNHKEPANQDDRKYKCKQCGRSYLHAASLFNHQKTHSIGVYKCPNCLKEFSNLLAFKNHLRIHRYNCKECGKAFRNSSDLAAHSETHDEGSFTCPLCNEHFLCRSTYKQHPCVPGQQDGDILDPQAVSSLMVKVT
ncbi:hypothetical protein GDO81_024463 [Engystomops pustulosus]|uniref:C2H2-type domain-containing protein n=1 Tax=Engystomops pustulosus TaxID=76066 RepID=A0AAV6ZQ27_ENGPU|nr:hypothetical protein GDO81_024463 [Engystomops pustulosus]